MKNIEKLAYEGARKCVNDWGQVRAGEEVLILSDNSNFNDPKVLDIFADVCREAKAVVSTMSCDTFNPREKEPPLPVEKALTASDIVFFFSPFPVLLHCRAGKKAMLEHGLRIVSVLTPTMDFLASEWARYPVDLLIELHKEQFKPFEKSREIKIVGENGTRISGLAPKNISTVDRSFLFNGLAWHGIWPGECGPCVRPIIEGNGVVIVDVLPGFKGFLKNKVKVTVENSRVVKIEGKKEADWFRNLIDASVKKGSDADLLHEIQWGVNPKGDLFRAADTANEDEAEISRLARTLHFGFGSGQMGFHWDVLIVDKFDLSIGEQRLIRDGNLLSLSNPKVIKLAQKYGDPEKILSEFTSLKELRKKN